MLTIYLVCAIVAGGVVLAGALGGLADHSALEHSGLDHHAGDHGNPSAHDSHLSHGTANDFWLPFFSMRFWTFGLASFGMLGLLLTLFRASAEPLTAIVAGSIGVVIGTIAALSVRVIGRSQIDSTANEVDMVGSLAKVLVAPRGDEPGKIRLTVKGDIIDMLAKSPTHGEFAVGEEVVVVGVEGSTAQISRTEDLLDELT